MTAERGGLAAAPCAQVWDEAHFRPLVERSRDLICLHEPDGRYRYISPSVRAMLGYRPEALIGGNPYDYFHPEQDVAQLRASHERTLAGLANDTVRYRFRHCAGHYVWLETLAVPLHEDASQPQRLTALLTSSRDVSAQVESEALHSSSEERLRLALLDGQNRLLRSQQLARVGDWRTDVNDPRDRWSEEVYRILGLSPETTVPSLAAFMAQVHPDDRETVLRAEQAASRDGIDFECDTRLLRPDGSERHVFHRTCALRHENGGVRGLYGTLQDITERKQAEASLRSTAAALEHAQWLARVGSWQWWVEGDVVHWSRELYNIFGRDAEGQAVSYAEHASLYAPESWARLQAAVTAALQTGTSYELELEFVRGDGSHGWGVARGEVQRDAGGAVIGLSGTVQDITERKHTEIALREARDQVRELSGHLEDELNLERKRIALDVHDELGQMLTAMKLQLELLQPHVARPAQAQQIAGRMRELIEETMEVTRNVALNLRPPALDLGLVAALEWLAEDFGLRTEIECQVHTPATDMLLGDKQATALFRIAQESLTNVARHARARRVTISLCLVETSLLLEIRDDGIGFDIAALRPPGHFGLLGMRERALRLGAELTIASRPGAGCAVRVRLARDTRPSA